MRLVITLSSIPTRFDSLDQTLRSLCAQTANVEAVVLYIPLAYRRFPEWDGVPPAVPAGVTVRRVEEDFGPATKILPAVRDYAGQDVELLFCDDDKIYDPGWAARYVAARLDHPTACIAEAGHDIADIPEDARAATRLPRALRARKGWRYRVRRTLSLWRYKPFAYAAGGHVDIFEGYGGVLVRPEFFSPAVFEIPDILWTVDDPWLSGNLETNGRPIWLNGAGRTPRTQRASGSDPLFYLIHDGHGRYAAHQACIDYYRSRHGIWGAGRKAG